MAKFGDWTTLGLTPLGVKTPLLEQLWLRQGFLSQPEVPAVRCGGQRPPAPQQLHGGHHQHLRCRDQVQPRARPLLPPRCHPQPGLTPVMSQRLNNAPVHGYEQDVGSKTTMRLFYPESAHFDPRAENNPDTLLVLVPFKPSDFQWMEAILNDKKRVSVVGNQVQPLPGCSRLQLSHHPTLGDILQVRKGFWKQPPLIWDANPEQVRVLNPYYMEVTAAKLLNLPMKQPRKVKQVRGEDGQSPCTP